jgi:hypothetical protein
MKFRRIACDIAATLVAAALAAPAGANNLRNLATVTNTDFAMFGYGGMSAVGNPGTDGTGTLTVSGISGTVTRALLIWHGPTSSTIDSVNAPVNFNGTPVTGTNVGNSDNNCWTNFDNSRAYQADVTRLVGGNGSYALSGFVKGAYPGPAADVNGVSLLVFYDDGNATNNRDIVVFLGNDSNQATGFDLPGWNVTLAGVRYTSGTATLRLVVSDGQSFADPEPVLVNATVVFPASQIFDGISLPAYGPSASTLNGGLWDHKSADITSTLAPGANTLTLTSAPINPAVADCLSLVATVFDLPAGAAPLPPEIIPTLSEGALALLALLTGGAAALQLRRRRT